MCGRGVQTWDVVVRFGFLRCGYGCVVWICDVAVVGLDLRCRGRERWENVRKVCWASLFFTHLGSIFFFFIFHFSFFFAKAGMVFYERRSEGLKNWRLDQGGVRWSEVGSLTEILYVSLTKCSGMGPTKIRKYWVMRSWKYVQNGWGIKIEWRVMSDERWVMEKKKTKQPLNSLIADGWCVSVCHCPLSCLFILN